MKNSEFWVRKLTSRKFWVAIGGFITALLIGSGLEAGTVEKVTSIIMAFATAIAYIIGEGLIDAQGVKSIQEKSTEE